MNRKNLFEIKKKIITKILKQKSKQLNKEYLFYKINIHITDNIHIDI